MKLKDCRKCKHYEREKTHDDDGGKTKVMCKFFINEGIEPFSIAWVEIYTADNDQSVRCPMELKNA